MKLLKWWVGTFTRNHCTHDWNPNKLSWGNEPHRMCKICGLQQTKNRYNNFWQEWQAGFKREDSEGHALPEWYFFWKDCTDENEVVYKTRAKTEVEDRY